MAEISVTTDGRDVLIETTVSGKRYRMTLEASDAEVLAKRLIDTARLSRLVWGACGKDVNRPYP